MGVDLITKSTAAAQSAVPYGIHYLIFQRHYWMKPSAIRRLVLDARTFNHQAIIENTVWA